MPSNQDATDPGKWIEYGIYLIIIFVVILVLGLIGYVVGIGFFCGRLCGCCGGCKPKKKGATHPYKKKDLVIPSILVIIGYLSLLVVCVLGLIFSGLFSQNVRVMVKETRGLVTNVNGTIAGVGSLSTAASEKVPVLVNAFSTLADGAFKFLTPVDNMALSVQDSINTLYKVNNTDAPIIYQHIDEVRADLRTLKNRTELQNVPDPNTAIPDVQSTVTSGINTGVSALQQGKTTIDDARASLNNTIYSTKDTINSTVYNTINTTVVSTLSSFTSQISSVMGMVNSYLPETRVDDVTYYVYAIENARISLVTIFFVWCGFLYIFTLLGIVFKVPILVEVTSCCTCGTAWLFFVVAAIQIPIYILVNDLCSTAPTTVKYLGDSYGNSLIQQSAGGFVTLPNVSVIIDRVATCTPGNSYLNATLGSDYLGALGIDNMLGTATGSISGALDSFNVSSLINTAKGFIQSANVSSIKTDYTSDVNSAQSQLDTAYSQLQDIQNFNGFSFANYTKAIDDVNAAVSPYGLYYTYENITLLDCNASPINQDSQAQQKCNTTKSNALDQLTLYNTTLTEVLKLNATASHLRAGLQTLVNDFNSLSNTFIPIKSLPNTLTSQLDTLASDVSIYVNDLKNSLNATIKSALTNYINSVTATSLDCGYVGSYVSTTEKTVCYGMTNQTLITGILSLIIGVIMIVMFIILLILGKRLRYQTSKGVADPPMGAEMMEPSMQQGGLPPMDLHH
ncbi:hypothetical protein C9374_000253 [Naegleria lovaniensis]|uniref:Uncharacterized protein n=1 Tax=Naegleria lovaniensis TaxID=51637 RepID=A0AA88GZF8_NAELO|nr:uncharacterized protein C9374_000253 [Naegleria lovaniensis]KAG2388814.1 hypothetical protein C9374_000253 [Naegleria lovaniensis]